MEAKDLIMMVNNVYGGSQEVFILELKSDRPINASPGQFVMLEALKSKIRRPFSIYSIEDNRLLGLLIKKRGKNTRAYAKLEPGEKIKVLFPLGKPLNPEAGKSYLLIAGGMGFAALNYFILEAVKSGRRVVVYFGSEDGSYNDIIKALKNRGCEVISQVGGKITDLLEEDLQEKAGFRQFEMIACGPKRMLKRVTELAETYRMECKVIVEEMMICGIGSCKSCAVFVKNSHMTMHACKDGPVFISKIIDWEKFCPEEKVEIVERKPLLQDPFKTVLLGQKGRSLQLDYPVMNGAGTLDTPAISSGQVNISKFGAILTKGICMDARPGNPTPRICEINGGLLNRIGLEGWGIVEFMWRHLPIWRSFGKRVIVTIFGKSVDEYGVLADIFESLGIGAIEMNLSCGNTEGRIFAQSDKLTYRAVERVRQLFSGFLMVKLTPMVSDIIAIARPAVSAGADALTLINTPLGMSIDVMAGKSKIAGNYAGMSGEVIRPLGVRMVHQVASANLGVPIVGVGGIANGYDAAEYLMAGASAVQVGTELFSNPEVGVTICDGLLKIAVHHGVEKISDLIGRCKKKSG